MTDERDLIVPQAAYDALLAGYPWIRSRNRFACLGRGREPLLSEVLDGMDEVVERIMVEHPATHVVDRYTKEKFAGLRVHFGPRYAPPGT